MNQRPRLHDRFVAAASLLMVLSMAAGCGGDRSGGPSGRPEDVVLRAPDVTEAAGTARVKINAPAAQAQGVIDVVVRSGRLSVTYVTLKKPADLLIVGGSGYLRTETTWAPVGGTLPEALRGGDPFANLDLIRGTVHILSDGGAEVDGASTIRYTLTIDPQQAMATTPPGGQAAVRSVLQGRTGPFMMDVWIDSKLQVRRVEVPADLTATTPATRPDRLPIATDVDYLAFGVPVGPVQPPPLSGG
jgi:hypothetical protein